MVITSKKPFTLPSQEQTLFTSTFSSAPSNWVTSGTWSYGSSGLTSTGPGGYTNKAYLNKYTTLDRCYVELVFNTTSSTAVIGIMKQWALSGTYAELRFNDSRFLINGQWDISTSPSVICAESALPFSYVSGRDYKLRLTRDKGRVIFKVTDTVTNVSGELNIGENYNPFPGSMWGNPGLMIRSGTANIKSFKYVALGPSSPMVEGVLDSFGDGYTRRDANGGYETRWVSRVFNKLNGNMIIAGKGGEDSTSVIPRLDLDLDSFTPTYFIIAIGTNDTVYSTWLANIGTIITRALAKGAIPILTTFAPRADRQSFLKQANDYVRAQGTYGYIDIERAVADGWGTASPTWKIDSTFGSAVMSDGVHPSTWGHSLIYQRTLIDIPQIYA